MLRYISKIKTAILQIIFRRKKRIRCRIANGTFSIGKDTRFSYSLLDFTGDGSIHIGKGCNIMALLATRIQGAVVRIGDRCFLGNGVSIVAAENVIIGNDVLIGGDCYISDNDGHSLDLKIREKDVINSRNGIKLWDDIGMSPVRIEDNVWIAPRCIILKGVTIGKGAVIGAGSVVTKDVPSMTLAAGNPARHIKSLA